MAEYAGVDRRDAICIITSQRDMDRSVAYLKSGKGEDPGEGFYTKNPATDKKEFANARRFKNSDSDDRYNTLLIFNYFNIDELNQIFKDTGWQWIDGKWTKLNSNKKDKKEKNRFMIH